MVSIQKNGNNFLVTIIKEAGCYVDPPYLYRAHSGDTDRYKEICNFFNEWKVGNSISLTSDEMQTDVRQRHGHYGGPEDLKTALEWSN